MDKRWLAEYTDENGVTWYLKSYFRKPAAYEKVGKYVLSLHKYRKFTVGRPVNDPRICDSGVYLSFHGIEEIYPEEEGALNALAEASWRRLVEIDLNNRDKVVAFKKANPYSSWSSARDDHNHSKVCEYTRAILESLDDVTGKLALGIFYGICNPVFNYDKYLVWPEVDEIIQAAKMAVS